MFEKIRDIIVEQLGVESDDESVLAKGLAERIGIEGSLLQHTPAGKDKIEIPAEFKDHTDAIKMVIEALVSPEYGVIKDMSEIGAVGHRVVHGGEKFSESVLINDEVMEAIRANVELAPLHNPANIMGIEACRKIMPNTPMTAVFDTAFHQTMPADAYLYAVPYETYEEYGIRRYGFHGTSHKYVALRTAALLNKPLSELKIITCHLGNGSSIAAVKHGKSVDTSMGFTPLEGLPMGTRSGNIDPAIISFMMEKKQLTPEQVNETLNKKSGVLGISGVSSDFRDLVKAANNGVERAQTALNVFNYQVKKYIGSYAAAMGGVDCIVFTAGIGENTPCVREESCKGLEFMGIRIDREKNLNTTSAKIKEGIISTEDSTVTVMVVPTNEELMIARDTMELI
jgi:acetate kinase